MKTATKFLSAVMQPMMLLVFGCTTDDHRILDPPAESPPLISTAAGDLVPLSAMTQTHSRLVQAMALSLDDDSLRMLVYEAMRNSQVRENKLHLRQFLSGEGRRVSARLDLHLGNDVTNVLDSIVDLEFYMPVDEHRAEWTGDRHLLVAGVLTDDGTIPVAFDLHGRTVTLTSAEVPPSTPSLVLVPVETRFDASESGGVPQLATTIGTTPAWYLTGLKVNDVYEGWGMGDPEFEIHAFSSVAGTDTLIDVACWGEKRTLFNYDDVSSWWEGDLMLLTPQEMGDDSISYHVWEDDAGYCGSESGRPPKSEVDHTAALAEVLAGIFLVYYAEEEEDLGEVTALVWGGIIFGLENHMFHADEFVGIVEEAIGGCLPATGPAAFYVRDTLGVRTGTARLDPRFGNSRTPLCETASPRYSLDVSISGSSYVRPDQ